jgi:hypothetical protein
MENSDRVRGVGAGAHNSIDVTKSVGTGNTILQGSNVTMYAGTRPLSAVEDRWTGGKRLLPSKEPFMLGPD